MKAVIKIVVLCSLCLGVGLAVAYYNTASLGYDNANIISFNNEELQVFDYNIKYEDVKEKVNKIKNAIPDEFVTI